MSLLNEFAAQTCLIGGTDNLDLPDLDFSMFDNIDLIDFSVYETEFSDISSLTQQSATTSHESPIEKPAVLAEPIQPTHTATQLDFELIDFDLIQTGLNASKTQQSFMDLLNSPSAERTYYNVNSIELSTEDDMSMLSSPASSVSDEQGVDKPRSRRTRGRLIDKKESNKAAAIRYRNKKLKEKDQLFAECEDYAQRIKELKQKVNDTQSEISFIKSLLVEALVLKTGLLK